jgi:hypothetical protein
MVRTYRHGEVDGCQGETGGLVDVPQERASFDSLLDHIVVFGARGIAESPFEKGIHVDSNSSGLACEFVKRAKCESRDGICRDSKRCSCQLAFDGRSMISTYDANRINPFFSTS